MVAHEQCDLCSCTARYTTANGKRTCSLCAMRCNLPAVRDIDMPAFLTDVGLLLDVLDAQPSSQTSAHEIRSRLRLAIGRRTTTGAST